MTASLSGVYELILVAATDGTLAADVRPLVRLSVSVLGEEDGKRERGASGGGGRFGYEFFLADLDGEVRADAWAKEAVRMALVNLCLLYTSSFILNWVKAKLPKSIPDMLGNCCAY